MHPILLVLALIVLCLAMVFAMVQYSRAYLAEREEWQQRERWGLLYLALWIAILGLLVAFVRRFDWMLVVVPGAWLGVHYTILRFGSALRMVALEDRKRAALEPDRVIENEDEEEEEEIEELPPPQPAFAQKAVALLRWIVSLAAILIVIAVGENLTPLRRLDEAIAPQRLQLQIFFGVLLAGGFAMFMGGIIHLVLTSRAPEDGELSFAEVQRAWREGTWREGTWRDSVRMRRFFVIAGGVALATLAGAALAIVTASPGVKLLVMLVVGYAIARIALAWGR